MLCGDGDSCSASGVDISEGDKHPTIRPIKSRLVPRDELIFHNRQREPVKFEEMVSSNVLFIEKSDILLLERHSHIR